MSNKRKVKVCQLSSVHYALDTRIFYRFCHTLKTHYDVTLIACHPVEEIRDGIHIIPYKRFHNRRLRVLCSWFLMFFKAIKVNAKIYQFHDPELIPCGLLLKLFGKEVIFDIHENIAEDIFDKPWIRNKKIAYRLFTLFEAPACRYFQVILTETSYEKRYSSKAKRWITIHNYCDVPFFKPYRVQHGRNLTRLFYIGIVLESRGILQIAEAVYKQKLAGQMLEFHCVGELYSDLKQKLRALPYYEEIKEQLVFHGRKNLEEGYRLSQSMGIGMCIIHPMSNSVESYPTKMFEYMAVGMPMIISDFPLYKSVVETHNCGICVNPMDPGAIASAVGRLCGNPELAAQMGDSGIRAVEAYYNWSSEKEKVLALYKKLLRL